MLIRVLLVFLLLPSLAHATVDWDEGFEYATNDLMDAVWSTSCPGNAGILFPSTDLAHSGSKSLKEIFRGHQAIGGQPATPGYQSCYKDRNLLAPTTGTLYSRFWIYLDNFTVDATVTKLTLHPMYASDAYTTVWWDMLWGSAGFNAVLQRTYPDPLTNDPTQIYYGAGIPQNQWVCMETQITYATPGQRNGVIRNWVNGVQGVNITNALMDQVGQQSTMRGVRLYVQDGVGTIYYDDYATSRDARIGCGASAPSDTTPPTQVAGLANVSKTSSSITMNWTANPTGDGVSSYLVQSCTPGGCTAFTTLGTSTSTTYTVTGLAASTLYRFRVSAQDAAGNIGTASSIVDVTTDAATALPTVTAFSASASGGTITSTGSPTDYRIEFGGEGAGSTSLIFTAAQVPGGVLTFVWPSGTTWACAHARNGVGTEDALAYVCNRVSTSTGAALRQHATNGRWFTDDSGRVIYLAGLSGTLTLPNPSRSALQDFTVTAPTDGFARANNADAGASWESGYTGANAFKIVSNGLECSVVSSGYCLETHTTALNADQATQILLRYIEPGTAEGNVTLLTRASAAPTPNGYFFKAAWNTAGSVTLSFSKLVGGVWTGDITTATTPGWASGDIFMAKSEGSTHTFYRNDVPVLTVVDASIASGGRAGIAAYTATATTGGLVLDEFIAWNLSDGNPTINDYVTAFNSLVSSGLNYFRGWLYPESTSWGEAAWIVSGEPRVPTAYMPWQRIGVRTDCTSGTCVMVGIYDLQTFNEAFFTKLRERALAAQARGLYFSIMPFEGWQASQVPYQAFSSPFGAGNNIQGIACDTNANGRCEENHTLAVPIVTGIQDAYVRKIIDSVGDLKNMFYEIVNEPNNTGTLTWQDHIADTIASYEATKPIQHLIMQSPYINPAATSNAYLRSNSRFDVIVPSCITAENYDTNPPVSSGTQIEMYDTDHTGEGDMCGTEVSGWPWKTFLRGRHPILLNERESAGVLTQLKTEMAQTITYANKVNLAAMIPSSGTSIFSTEYGLADACNEYLMYMPSDGSSSINLTTCPGGATYDVEYLNVTSGAVSSGGTTTGGASRSFNPAGTDPMVVYLKLNSITDTTAPVVSGGQPYGAQASGTTSVTVTVVTDKAATCKLDPTADTAYGSMATTFSSTGALLHTQSVGSLTDGTSYVRYVKCSGTASGVASSDYPVSWSILTAVDTVLPLQVPTLVGTTSGTSILWQWTVTGDADLSGYQLDISEGTSFISPLLTATQPTLQYLQSGVSAGEVYTARVKAIDTAGNLSATWRVSSPVLVDALPTVTGLAAEGIYATSLVLTYAASGIDGTELSLERCTGAACTTGWATIGTTSASSFLDTGRTASTTYGYRAKFVHPTLGGSSAAYSDTLYVTTLASITNALTRPRTPLAFGQSRAVGQSRLPRN